MSRVAGLGVSAYCPLMSRRASPDSAARQPLAGSQESETAALESLATRFGSVLLQFFERRVHNRHEAEDLTQEVFVRLLRRGRMEKIQNMRGYLFECAANTLNDRFRVQRSR